MRPREVRPLLRHPLAVRRVTAFLFGLLAATSAPAQLVERVVDGDTIIVEGVGRVRLIGVDTPETVHPNRPVEFFGREASAFTKGLLEGKRVRLEYDQERQDRYGRTLAYVYLTDGTFVNAEIIRRGYGHAYTRFPFRHMEAFRQFEREARDDRRGLWGEVVGGSSPRASSSAEARSSTGGSGTVYVTRTGRKYHREGCRFLSKSKIPMKRNEAVERYEPCGVCKPD
ncbi:MAG: thermonuclease family protein [Holophagales bacterium]|nr:thermonuclease family protein [Holophagales bacterium]MYH26378.1 thermonuclease family protein [Holophagales bacterium]